MGYELRRALRKALGQDITGLQRAVALEIADDANDATRLSYVSLEDLREWTAAKDVGVIRTTLKRLGTAGWEFRVPLGIGKDGRVLYAVPGRRLNFRVPDFEGGTTVAPMGEPWFPLGAEGGTTVPTEGTVVPSEGTTVTPFSSVPSNSSSLFSPASADAQLPPGASSDEREKILIAYTTALGRPVDGFVRRQILDQAGQLLADQFPLWWLEARAKELPQYGFDLIKHCRLSKAPVQAQRPADGLPDWCGRCFHSNNRMIKDPARDNELVECEACNPIAIARQRRAATGDAA